MTHVAETENEMINRFQEEIEEVEENRCILIS